MNARRRLLAGALALCLGGFAGCISVPDEVEADFQQPDGKRPNNFGRMQDGKVVPDRPTIGRVSSASVASPESGS